MALLPPVVASSMPAFNIEEGEVKIYFTLSNYNQKEDIKKVHVTVRRQSSNVSVLKTPSDILEKDYYASDNNIANEFYVIINNSDLKENFQVDALYKVQLRFSAIAFEEGEDQTAHDFFTNGIRSFSLWSTVCIIKPIKAPLFYIDELYYLGAGDLNLIESSVHSLSSPIADFTGVYKADESTLVLKTWRVRLLTSSFTKEHFTDIDKYTLSDSGEIIVTAYNYTLDTSNIVFECSLPYLFEEGEEYKLLFEIETKNGYRNYELYTFQYNYVKINEFDPQADHLITFINEEEGYIKLELTTKDPVIDNLVIRRTDMSSNFKKWEDLKNFEGQNAKSWTYYDFTIESGLAYRYCVQKRDIYGRRGTPLLDDASQGGLANIIEFEHPFLLETAGNGDIDQAKQLKLKYDFQISSYTTNILENKTDTIGSKYPYIRRNGDMYYRSFPCTGTITTYMDNVDLFASKEEVYDTDKKGLELYEELLKGEDYEYIQSQYDYTFERKFREKVEEFLYNSKPKLYKSMQEGNILIKLMEVSLTPKQELNRLIYTFSATAYEIDKVSILNLDYYGFINIGTYNPAIEITASSIGQINSYKNEDEPQGIIFEAGKDIIGGQEGVAASPYSIAKQEKYGLSKNNLVISDFNLTYLKITVESEPYLIIEENGVFRPYDDIDRDGKDPIDFTDPIKKKLYQILSTYTYNNEDVNIYLGTLFTIDGKQVIVSYPNNIYELKDLNLYLPKMTTIIPAKDTLMTVDYYINTISTNDLSGVAKLIQAENKVGQIYGKYNGNDNLISTITHKYYTTYNDSLGKLVKQYSNGVFTVSIDTLPGAYVWIRTNQDDDEELFSFRVNETGELTFDPLNRDYTIESLRISKDLEGQIPVDAMIFYTIQVRSDFF